MFLQPHAHEAKALRFPKLFEHFEHVAVGSGVANPGRQLSATGPVSQDSSSFSRPLAINEVADRAYDGLFRTGSASFGSHSRHTVALGTCSRSGCYLKA